MYIYFVNIKYLHISAENISFYMTLAILDINIITEMRWKINK